MNKETMDDYLKRLLHDANQMFPCATAVDIFISYEEVEVTPHYSGERTETSMKTISGEWCSKRGKSI